MQDTFARARPQRRALGLKPLGQARAMIGYLVCNNPGRSLLKINFNPPSVKGAFTYDVSSRGGSKMLTRGGGLSLADVSKNTYMLAKIVSNQVSL